MFDVHNLSKTEATRRLTAAVRASQGRAKASWAAVARPAWWEENHPVTLANGAKAVTGEFISNSKKPWKVSQVRAALYLYEMWCHGKEDDLGGSGEGKGKESDVEIDIGKAEPKEEPAVIPRPRKVRSRNTKAKKESDAVPEPPIPRAHPNTTGERHVSRASASSDASFESASDSPFESPSPVVKRTRRRARKVSPPAVPSPTVQHPIRKTRRGRGTRLARKKASPKLASEAPRRPARRSTGSTASLDEPHTSRASEDDLSSPGLARSSRSRDKGFGKTAERTVLPVSSPARRPTRKTKKRSLSVSRNVGGSEETRVPLTEKKGAQNVPDNAQKKKPRTRASLPRSTDKENSSPPATRATREKKQRNGQEDATAEKLTAAKKFADSDVRSDEEDEFGQARQAEGTVINKQMKAKRTKLIRDLIANINEQRKRLLRDLDRAEEEFEDKMEKEKNMQVAKVKEAYRSNNMKFSKKILDMPIREFANEHGCNPDAWMMRDAERGVDKTLTAVQNDESDPEREAMPPPPTQAARTRREAITKTARKTGRRIRERAEVASTVRRSKRTAAKAAIAKNRILIANTPSRQPVAGEPAFSANNSPLDVGPVAFGTVEVSRLRASILRQPHHLQLQTLRKMKEAYQQIEEEIFKK